MKQLGEINPCKLELYFEPSGSYGDFDLIFINEKGLWEWKHSEYYPEYYVGKAFSEAIRCREKYTAFGSPPNDFPEYIDPADPEYGEEVNSLCWNESYFSVDELIESLKDDFLNCSIAYLNTLSGSLVKRLVMTAYVNPNKSTFSPQKSISCSPSECSYSPPIGYIHWLSLGYNEENSALNIFYPKKARKNIIVKVMNNNGEITNIPWRHGNRGLLREKILPLLDKKKLNDYHRECRLEFIEYFRNLTKNHRV